MCQCGKDSREYRQGDRQNEVGDRKWENEAKTARLPVLNLSDRGQILDKEEEDPEKKQERRQSMQRYKIVGQLCLGKNVKDNQSVDTRKQ